MSHTGCKVRLILRFALGSPLKFHRRALDGQVWYWEWLLELKAAAAAAIALVHYQTHKI